ncbi:MAG: hypothetical protein H7A46_00090 [Verrucomicrobiales bacterium]|nr:hypothetical protein [Verrucomicrobiales bacterium]
MKTFRWTVPEAGHTWAGLLARPSEQRDEVRRRFIARHGRAVSVFVFGGGMGRALFLLFFALTGMLYPDDLKKAAFLLLSVFLFGAITCWEGLREVRRLG